MPALASAAAALATALAGLLLATPGPVVDRSLRDPEINESSGLAVSARHPGLLWTHNDGGSVARLLGVDASGRTVARVTLAGIDPYDPEALAPGRVGGRPGLYLGDIGDNLEERPDVSVFAVREPRRLGDATATATWYRFTYPDGPHDAEALLVGPNGRLLIATKGFADAGLYRAPARLVSEAAGTNELTRIADVPPLVTDGAYLPDGRFALRTYSAVHVYDRPGHQVAVADLPPQPQGESLAADGDHLLVGSEGLDSEVLPVPVPGGTRRPVGGAAQPGLAGTPERGLLPRSILVLGGAALVLGAVGVVTVLGARRRRMRGG